jgi:hypothetical protein
MKKILILFACLICFVTAQSQTARLNLKDSYSVKYTGVTADKVVDSLATLTKVFYVDAYEKYSISVQVDVDSLSTRQNATIALYGSYDGVKLIALGTGSSTLYRYVTGIKQFILTGGTSVKQTIQGNHAGDTAVYNFKVSKNIALDYPYIVLKITNNRSGDTKLTYAYVKITEFIKED